eukprot:CAMPEP_0194264934 /NCGR_PEP_ID=MMETSP0169-20130528/300_1 /TAXON_ID=218684 /ORGANISM="Corethron pennatum, Strain L29A3" /LENGTH=132 /DNA_ID=CAMNT_0039005287 /DNA_START=243 /DNA_END=642 /DNA_ORIENTATION=+
MAVEFRPAGGGCKSAKEEKERKEREAESCAAKGKRGGRKQKRKGGVENRGTGGPVLRVQARRCNMDDDTIVKEMSEELIVRKLQDDLPIWLMTRQCGRTANSFAMISGSWRDGISLVNGGVDEWMKAAFMFF